MSRVTPSPKHDHDRRWTLENRDRLCRNRNLLHWYRRLYEELFADVPDLADRRVLEVGSGASPLKSFHPTVITSDILDLDHLDLVFDCLEIGNVSSIPDHSINILTMTNVLHHLRDPIRFLQEATRKLTPGGHVYMVEPFFSTVSHPIYRLLHHEPVRFEAEEPMLPDVLGPLSSSNQAIPYMIFFQRLDWLQRLGGHYELARTRVGHFSSLSYMCTGGISRRLPIPHAAYRACFELDRWLASTFPRVFASFFMLRLEARP